MVLGDSLNRSRANWESGRLDTGINSTVTGLTSFDFASLPAVAAPKHLALVLDHMGVGGSPEIVWVTKHVAGSTSVTVRRGREGTGSRSHVAQTTWLNALTTFDMDDVDGLIKDLRAKTSLTDTTVVALTGRVTSVEARVLLLENAPADWNTLLHKPSSFPPSAHNHAGSAITSGTVDKARLPSGTTSSRGVVQLNNTVTSTATTQAATAAQVKKAWDKANHTHPYAKTAHSHSYLPLSGDARVTGKITFANTTYLSKAEFSDTAMMHFPKPANATTHHQWAVSGLKNIMIQDSTSAPTGGDVGDVVMNYNWTATAKGLWVNTMQHGWVRIATL